MTKEHQFKTLNINYKRKLYKAQHTHTHTWVIHVLWGHLIDTKVSLTIYNECLTLTLKPHF